jgi:hypothetical protein
LTISLSCLLIALPALAQEAKPPLGDPADPPQTPPPSSPAPENARQGHPRSPSPYDSRDEGELIQLEDVQIHGEIAQPNVLITVSRAQPQFRELTLEHTGSEGMSGFDLSGLKNSIPPAQRLKNWKEMLNKPRQ